MTPQEPVRERKQVLAVPVYGGFKGVFRKRDGWEYVCVNGVEQVYPSEDQARLAAYEARESHLFGDGILSTGHKAEAARFKAEELFGAIFKKGRKIVIERKNGRR